MSDIWYVPRDSLIKVEKMNMDFELETMYNTYSGSKGDYIATKENKDKFIITQDDFEKNYIKVRVVHNDKKAVNTYSKELLENLYKDFYSNYGKSMTQEEDWSSFQNHIKY